MRKILIGILLTALSLPAWASGEITFWHSDWCGNCKKVEAAFNTPEVQAMLKELEITVVRKRFEMGSAQQIELTKNGIVGLPTLILTKDGNELGRLYGAQTSESLLAELERFR